MPWPQRRNTAKNRPPRDVTALTLTPTIDDTSTTSKSSPTTARMAQSHPSDGQAGVFNHMGMAAAGGAYDSPFTAHPDYPPAGSAWSEQTYMQTPTNGRPPQGLPQNQTVHRTQSLMHTTSSSSGDSTFQSTNGAGNNLKSNTNNQEDLQTLERLKSEILAGQNPIYKAVPQPRFLESLYLGRGSDSTVNSNVPAHPDQVSDGEKTGRSAHDSTLETSKASATNAVHTGSLSVLGEPLNKSDSRAHNNAMKTERGSQDGPRILDKTSSEGSIRKHDDKDESMRDPTLHASQHSTGSLSAKPTLIVHDSRDLRYSSSQSAGSLGGSFSRDRTYDSRRSDFNRDIPADDDRVPRREFRENRYHDPRHFDREVRERGRERSRSRERDRDRRVVDNRIDERRIPEHLPPRERRPTIPDSREIRPQDTRRQEYRAMDVDRRSIPATPPDRAIRPNDDPRAIPADVRRDYPSRRESISRSGDQNMIPRTPILSSSPDKGVERARPSDSQNRPTGARDRSIDAAREGAGDERVRAPPYDDRARQPAEPPSDRTVKPDPANLEERLSRPLENRISDRPHVPLEERIGAPSERSSSRPPPALQERISDRPALEERIGNRPASAIDDRNIPSEAGRSLESRLSQHSQPAARERRVSEGGARPSDDDRGRPENDSRADERRPGAYGSGPVHSSPRPSLNAARTRPGSPHQREQDARRISPGPPGYRDEREGRFVDSRRIDVDSRRIDVDGPARYERPAPPPRERDRDRNIPPVPLSDDRTRPSMEAREWRERGTFAPPATESYSRDERYPPSSEQRDWSDRSYRPPPPSQWEGGREIPGAHDLGRARERYDEREPPRGAWDASQRDDRRVPGSIPPPPRSWDRADDAMAARTRESFPPPVERGPPSADRNTDRFVSKYPPSEYPPRDGGRVRPRSPSPIRRPADDSRPPIKRAREEGPGYYEDPRRIPGPPPSAPASSKLWQFLRFKICAVFT
ncbi:hypothetical protein SCHPADRAFT_926202 [Schizopora paradoxa]|uniref:Uncharacterized protein n=1 Tax=Schizopora paradoxa TaxID=27342 RepID=A0A0H2RXY7_9AGAM|nr:hypothetical protein SCHPADRAFT_926202 [Schizopora paradoxa]